MLLSTARLGQISVLKQYLGDSSSGKRDAKPCDRRWKKPRENGKGDEKKAKTKRNNNNTANKGEKKPKRKKGYRETLFFQYSASGSEKDIPAAR